MLNLSEQWKKAYAEYLEEQDSKISEDLDIICGELLEAQEEITKSYTLLENYFLLTLNEDETERKEAPIGASIFIGKDREEPIKKQNISMDVNDLMKQLIELGEKSASNKEIGSYEPAATFSVQTISDMKFPQNIIFFIGQLIKWIRNIVIFFIEKIKNVFRRLIGADPVKFDYNSLKLDLERAKKVEQVSTSLDLGKGSNGVIKAWKMDPSSVKLLESENIAEADGTLASFFGITKKEAPAPVAKQPVIITVDLSRDIMNLKELMQHFYDLFDGAYGSNNEKLFASDDLKVILELFKDTVEKIKTGDLNVYSVNGSAIEVSGINKERVKQNLVVTNQNINNLKEAYMQTSAKIQDITKIIQSKEMMMLSDMGVDFRLLTSSTYEQLKKILDTMPNRLKEAKKLEKDMTKVQNEYDKLIKELNAMQRTMQAVSTVNYDTIYNRRLVELLSSANWMSQTVTLRLAGLALYIRELKEVRDAIVMLAGVNHGDWKNRKLYKF